MDSVLDISNFQKFLKDEEEIIIDEFLRKYIINFRKIEDEESQKIENFFTLIIKSICSGDIKSATSIYKDLIDYNIELDIPYIMLTYELINLKKIILQKLLYKDVRDELMQLYKMHMFFEDMIAKTYLNKYIVDLNKKNNFSLSNLSGISQGNVIYYYKMHLEWLENLCKSIVSSDINIFPEIDHSLCTFGKWLNKEGLEIIKNSSKYKNISKLHENLHFFAKQIKNCLIETQGNNHIILIYLEKCEMLSLSLGTELALIDNTLINSEALKDPLTGALNRQKLSQLYQNQLEISFATFEPFVIAMCDFDHFKNINDTFGHLAGDKMLKSFVHIAKKHLRTSDIIIRYGGEEFMIILPAINTKKAKDILNKIREDIANFVLNLDGNKISATISIGMIEIYPENGNNSYFKDFENTISLVDKKLYEAKNSGRNTIC
ncbi:diguanylate cyclase [Aliarcobacter butzleri]|uniref:diguanylate cyclase n=1 Tax=Aliarcobacter butzleri TaxID=28197 RepID=UPI00263E7428|nr:diguanylate cyclase [Aliarcobacter butzleri]MDN5091618.1 diguanylate cyclase [Aliarcobacter butzleri]